MVETILTVRRRARGRLYRQSAEFAVEPQGFPNAQNQPNFPSTILRPGQVYPDGTRRLYQVDMRDAEAYRRWLDGFWDETLGRLTLTRVRL